MYSDLLDKSNESFLFTSINNKTILRKNNTLVDMKKIVLDFNLEFNKNLDLESIKTTYTTNSKI